METKKIKELILQSKVLNAREKGVILKRIRNGEIAGQDLDNLRQALESEKIYLANPENQSDEVKLEIAKKRLDLLKERKSQYLNKKEKESDQEDQAEISELEGELEKEILEV